MGRAIGHTFCPRGKHLETKRRRLTCADTLAVAMEVFDHGRTGKAKDLRVCVFIRPQVLRVPAGSRDGRQHDFSVSLAVACCLGDHHITHEPM